MRIAIAIGLIVLVVVVVAALRAIFKAATPQWRISEHVRDGRRIVQLEKPGEEPHVIDAVPIDAGNYDQRMSKAEDRAYQLCAEWNATERSLR